MAAEHEKIFDTLKKSVNKAECDFLDTLNGAQDPENIAVFHGMILYIYRKCFMPDSNDILPNARLKNTTLDINSPDALKSAWHIYIDLCMRYNKTVSVIQFCAFIGIDYDTLIRYANGINKGTSQTICQIAKKIFSDAESATYGQAVDGNRIGAIFALKSKFGYTDTRPQEIIIHNGAQLSASEIQNKYLDLLPDNSTAQLTDNSDAQNMPENMPEMVN